MSTDESCYRIVDKSQLDIEQIRDTVVQAWRDMLTDGTSENAAAKKRGIDLSALPRSPDEAVDVRPAGAGVAGVDVIIVGLLAKMAYDAWKDVWKHVIFPRIKAKYGVAAIEPIEPPKETKPKANRATKKE